MDKTVLFSISPEELRSIVIDSVNACLRHSSHIQLPEDADKWLDLDEVIAYDPEKRTKPTWYGYVSRRVVPFHKKNRKLYFLKSEIDEWLKEGRQKTREEAVDEAHVLLKKRGAE